MKQYKCKACLHQFDTPTIVSGSYNEYYGSKFHTYSNETCPECGSPKMEQQYCLLNEPNECELERDMLDTKPYLDPQWE